MDGTITVIGIIHGDLVMGGIQDGMVMVVFMILFMRHSMDMDMVIMADFTALIITDITIITITDIMAIITAEMSHIIQDVEVAVTWKTTIGLPIGTIIPH